MMNDAAQNSQAIDNIPNHNFMTQLNFRRVFPDVKTKKKQMKLNCNFIYCF